MSLPNIIMQQLEPQDLNIKQLYQILISAVVPRPIAWVSTINESGVGNLAPFSFFNGVGTAPPALMFSIVPKTNGEKKDTLRNILATKEFVVNGVNEASLSYAQQSSADYEYGEDEAEKIGLTKLPSQKVKPCRIQGSPWHFECRLYDTLTVGSGGVGSGTIVVGEIISMHLAKELLTDFSLDYKKMKPVARLGGNDYLSKGDIFSLKR